MNSKLKRIYEERSQIYNCSIEQFEDEGITLMEVESMRGKGYFTLAHFRDHLFVRIDPEMEVPIDKLDMSLKGKPLDVMNALKDHYASSDRMLEKTYCYYYYLKDEPLINHSSLIVKRITDDQADQLNTFLNRLSEEDLELADIELDKLDPVIFGGYVDNKIVAYISHRYPIGHELIGDIGIVIDSEYRGKGFGKTMLIHEVNWCLENGIVPMYVVLDGNKASSSLVQKVGFEQVCEIYRLK